MAEETVDNNEDSKIPPKLDLRKSGVLKSGDSGQTVDKAKSDADAKDEASQTLPAGQPAKLDTESADARPAVDKGDGEKPKLKPQSAPDTLKIKLPQSGANQNRQTSGQRPDTGTDGESGMKIEAPGTSPTVHIKMPGTNSKPGSPVKLKGSGEGEQKAVRTETVNPAVGIQSGGGDGAAKKETSKIPLEQAKSVSAKPQPNSNRPHTIRIKPAGQESQKAQNGASDQDSKKKTSRISLEAALAGQGGSGDVPKTIKLKRPGAGPGKVTGGPQIKQVGSESDAGDEISKTSQLGEAVQGENATPTRRKTIKVKRAGTGATVRKAPKLARSGPAPQPQVAQGAQPIAVAPPKGEKEPGVIFSLIAIAAMLVVFVSIYVMAAQAFGPNRISLTQLSYGLPGLELSWPGKIY